MQYFALSPLFQTRAMAENSAREKKLTPLKEAAFNSGIIIRVSNSRQHFFSLIKQPPTFTVQLS
jgi:hypothetical protein